MTKAAEQAEVVVVGAGVSGLRVANALATERQVVVLEARDRVGGRLRSPNIGGSRRDVGATWFWPNEPRIIALLADLDIATYPQHGTGQMVFHDGANDPQRVPNQLDTPSGRIDGGFELVAQAMAERLDVGVVRLGTPALGIRTSDQGLEVETPSGLIAAEHVVVALPPALAVSAIDFAGRLDDRVRSVASLTPVWMGSTVKVVVTYEDAFWRREGLAGSAFSYAGPMRELHDMSGPEGEPAAIFGFCALGPDEPAPSDDAVTAQMIKLFGTDAGSPTAIEITDWRHEPHTVPIEAVSLTNYQTYGHDVYQSPALGGRLHWSSTETATEMPGHVEGALAAADRTVRAILASHPAKPLKETPS